MGSPFWDPVPGTAEGPTLLSDPWDVVLLDGEKLPGKGTVKCEPKVGFEVKSPPGFDGAVVTLKGYLPGPVLIELSMWTAAQWDEFQRQLPRIWRKPNAPTRANRDVARAANITPAEARNLQLSQKLSHPAISPYGVTDVIVVGISLPEEAGVTGVRVVRIRCQEFLIPTRKAPTKVRPGPGAPLAPQLNPASNKAGEAPSKTDIHPCGPAQSRVGGVS